MGHLGAQAVQGYVAIKDRMPYAENPNIGGGGPTEVRCVLGENHPHQEGHLAPVGLDHLGGDRSVHCPVSVGVAESSAPCVLPLCKKQIFDAMWGGPHCEIGR